MKEPEESKLQSTSPEKCNDQQLTDMTTDKSYDLDFRSVNWGTDSSESVCMDNKQPIQETDSTPQQGTESKLLLQIKTSAQVIADECPERLQECDSRSLVQ